MGKSFCPCLKQGAFSKDVHTNLCHPTSSIYKVTEIPPSRGGLYSLPLSQGGLVTAGEGCCTISEARL